jgi:hypothetical protein
MGYYTQYKLTVYEPEDHGGLQVLEESDDFNGDFNDEFNESHAATIAGIADYKYLFEESCKWYDHEEDMIAYSKKHPNLVFKLHGEGEESGNIWNKWFVNGKVQTCHAKIVFDPFDPTQLK